MGCGVANAACYHTLAGAEAGSGSARIMKYQRPLLQTCACVISAKCTRSYPAHSDAQSSTSRSSCRQLIKKVTVCALWSLQPCREAACYWAVSSTA